MICLMSNLACTAVLAPTDLTSQAEPEIEPESLITSLSHPHIVEGVMAWCGCLLEIQKRGSDLDLSLLKVLSSLTK